MDGRKRYQVGLTVINVGDSWAVPGLVVPDWIETIWRQDGVQVLRHVRPGRFRMPEFAFDPQNPTLTSYRIPKGLIADGNAIDISDLPNGDYDVSFRVLAGPSNVVKVSYNINGENCNLIEPITFPTFVPPVFL